jgi:hypothetical protein
VRTSQILHCLVLFLCVPSLGRTQTRAPVIRESLRQINVGDKTNVAVTNAYLNGPQIRQVLEGVGVAQSFTILDFDNDVYSHNLQDQLKTFVGRDTRVYYTAQLDPKLSLYFRGKVSDLAFAVTPGITKPDFRIQQPLDLELGWVEYVRSPTTRFKLGRQFMSVGQGIVVAEPLDGLNFQTVSKGISLGLFWGTTPNRLVDVDETIVGYNQGLTHRDFSIFQMAYQSPGGDRYYGYYVDQHDQSQTLDPVQASLDFHYHSNYTGIGTNLLLSKNVALTLEAIKQGGSTLAENQGDFTRVGIDAFGAYAAAAWALKGRNEPVARLEYAFGSGDRDRGTVTGTFGGKALATTDRNFLYFGILETGLALTPRLSNLHILRLGYQQRLRLHGRAIEDTDPQLSLKLSSYYKEHARAVISETLADGTGSHVGDALDFYLAWRVAADTTFNSQVGFFKPGNGFPDDTRDMARRILVSTTLTY